MSKRVFATRVFATRVFLPAALAGVVEGSADRGPASITQLATRTRTTKLRYNPQTTQLATRIRTARGELR